MEPEACALGSGAVVWIAVIGAACACSHAAASIDGGTTSGIRRAIQAVALFICTNGTSGQVYFRDTTTHAGTVGGPPSLKLGLALLPISEQQTVPYRDEGEDPVGIVSDQSG